MAGKQACRVTIFTKPEQDEIKIASRFERLRIAQCALRCAQLSRNRVHLRFGNGHMLRPDFSCHVRIALRIIRRQATFVAEIEVPCAPVCLRGTQLAINVSRRISAGQHEMKLSAFSDGSRSPYKNHRLGLLLQGVRIGDDMPAAPLLVCGFHRVLLCQLSLISGFRISRCARQTACAWQIARDCRNPHHPAN